MSITEQATPARRSARPQVTSEQLLQDQENGYDQPMDLMQTNVASVVPVREMDAVSAREFKDLIEYESFMNDPMVIRVLETNDVNAPWRVFVGINGDMRWIPRGKPVRIQRRFVERLAQSQERRFITKENNDRDSDDGFTTLTKSAQSYQFEVLKDDHPQGRRWLTRMMREGS